LTDTKTVDRKAAKELRKVAVDVSVGIAIMSTRQEIGGALLSILETDADNETKLDLIATYAAAYKELI